MPKVLLVHMLAISLAFLGCNKSSDSDGEFDSLVALSLLTGAPASENSLDREPDNRPRREFHGFLNRQDGQPCRECNLKFIESSDASASSLLAFMMGKSANQRLTVNLASNLEGKYTVQLPESNYNWEVRNFNNTEILSKGSIEIKFSDPQPSFTVDPGSQLQVTIYDSENTQPVDGIIKGISPIDRGVFFSQYQELGNHFQFGNNCQFGSNFTLEKFRLTSNTVASIEFDAPVSIENAVLENLGEPGVPISGELIEINSKHFIFETHAPGIPFATYKIHFSGMKVLETGRDIEDKSWNFSIGFNPDSGFGRLNQVSLNCANQDGTNVCQYQATMHFSGSKLGIADNSKNHYSTFYSGVESFELDIGVYYHFLDGAMTPIFIERCESTQTIPNLSLNQYVYIKIFGQAFGSSTFGVPAELVEENRFIIDSFSIFSENDIERYTYQWLMYDDFEETNAIQN